MPHTLEDVQRVVETTGDTFYSDLYAAVTRGMREISTGWDMTLIDWIDPRITKGFGLDVALSRALAMTWRVGDQSHPSPVLMLAGTAAGEIVTRELPIEEWHLSADLFCSADGLSFENCYGSQVRKLRISGQGDVLRQMFGIEDEDVVPGTMTLVVGRADRDLFLQNLTGGGGDMVILLLYGPDSVVATVRGSPTQNLWRPHLLELEALNGSHVTEPLSDILFNSAEDPWYNKTFREQLFANMRETCSQHGRPLTGRMFLDVLAESSPLRENLTAVLCRSFPEVEQVFWCNGDETWDTSSPTERFAMLLEGVNVKQDSREAKA